MDLLPGSPSPMRAKKPSRCAKAGPLHGEVRAVELQGVNRLPFAGLKDHLTRHLRNRVEPSGVLCEAL